MFEAMEELLNMCQHTRTIYDGMLFPDDAWNLDPEQGPPNLRSGIFARVEKREGH